VHKSTSRLVGSTIALLIVGIGVPSVFADGGEDPNGFIQSGIFTASSLDLIDNGFGVTFSGKGGYSADGLGTEDGSGTISADIPAGSTIEDVFLYATTYDLTSADITSVMVDLDGTTYTLAEMTNSEYDGCCDLRSFKHISNALKTQVAAKFASDGPGVINFAASNETPPDKSGNDNGPAIDGIGLVVIFSNPASDDVSVAILDGGLSTMPATTTLFLATSTRILIICIGSD